MWPSCTKVLVLKTGPLRLAGLKKATGCELVKTEKDTDGLSVLNDLFSQ